MFNHMLDSSVEWLVSYSGEVNRTISICFRGKSHTQNSGSLSAALLCLGVICLNGLINRASNVSVVVGGRRSHTRTAHSAWFWAEQTTYESTFQTFEWPRTLPVASHRIARCPWFPIRNKKISYFDALLAPESSTRRDPWAWAMTIKLIMLYSIWGSIVRSQLPEKQQRIGMGMEESCAWKLYKTQRKKIMETSAGAVDDGMRFSRWIHKIIIICLSALHLQHYRNVYSLFKRETNEREKKYTHSENKWWWECACFSLDFMACNCLARHRQTFTDARLITRHYCCIYFIRRHSPEQLPNANF